MEWEFEGYKVELVENDVLEFCNSEGEVLGTIVSGEMQDLIDGLNNGDDPIAEGWEDGAGNTISLEGWE